MAHKNSYSEVTWVFEYEIEVIDLTREEKEKVHYIFLLYL